MMKLDKRLFEEAPDSGNNPPAGNPPAGDPPASPPAGDPPSTPPAGDPPANYFATTPEGWRDDLIKHAGYEGDEASAMTNILARVPDIGSMAKNYRAMQEKISKGEISTGLPENPTEDQLNAYREANGVPTSPEGYEIKAELSEPEQEMFSAILGPALDHNVPNEGLNAMVDAFKGAQQSINDKLSAQDNIDAQNTNTVLRDNWGPDYQANMNRIDSLLEGLPESVRDEFKTGRMANGMGLFNSPEVLSYFADIQRRLDPTSTVVPNATNPAKSIKDEIGKLEQTMKDNYSDWGSPKFKAENERLLELYQAESQMNGG